MDHAVISVAALTLAYKVAYIIYLSLNMGNH